MNFTKVYTPVSSNLKKVEAFLASSVKESDNPLILSMSELLLGSPGKGLRPALTLLSQKVVSLKKSTPAKTKEVNRIAAAMELIHIASLVHDDIIDGASKRHSRPSINARWGSNVSIVFGDYIYSKAMEIVGSCKRADIFTCASKVIYMMCEGELLHVIHRGNLDLSANRYLQIIEKKTASLFSACCHIGAMLGNNNRILQEALREFGLNFGMAFQILDDYNDIVRGEESLGKSPGQDLVAGDITLPLINLLQTASKSEKKRLIDILQSKRGRNAFQEIKEIFIDSKAADLTFKTALSYIKKAKRKLGKLENSDYKNSLVSLADYITGRNFSAL